MASRFLWSQREAVRPCEYHARALGLFREFIETTDSSIQQRQTIQDEVGVLNQAIKDGLEEHVARPGYQPIPHRAEWQEQEQDAETGESVLERRVRELEQQNWHLRTDQRYGRSRDRKPLKEPKMAKKPKKELKRLSSSL